MDDPRLAVAEVLRAMPAHERTRALSRMPPGAVASLAWLWELQARPEQVWRPHDRRRTIYMAGRGWGKTRTGAEAVSWVARRPHLLGGGWIGIAGRTYTDDVLGTMIHGPSGIATVSPPDFRPRYNSARKTLVWPNGVIAKLVSGDVPESARGPNFGLIWCDELPHWRRAEDTWQQMTLALRLGISHAIVTTTPLGTPIMRSLVYEVDRESGEIVTGDDGAPVPNSASLVIRGRTRDNAANLSEVYRETIADLDGSRIGRQELDGELLLDHPGACWRIDWIRRISADEVPDLARVVVAVDPSVTSHEDSDETGIVVVGASRDGRVFVLEDASGVMTSREWAARACALAHRHRAAIVCEENQGGDLVRQAILSADPRGTLRVEGLRAAKAKRDRWTVAAIPYEQGIAYHVGSSRSFEVGAAGRIGTLAILEQQMTGQDPDRPGKRDRADALAWGVLAIRDRIALTARGRAWMES